MRWVRSGLQSISGWLMAPAASTAEPPAQILEAIRQAMLEALGAAGAARRPRLAARIRNGRDVESLWAARGELMTAIAQAEGEWHAGLVLVRVTALFRGLLPQASRACHPRARSGMSAWPGH